MYAIVALQIFDSRLLKFQHFAFVDNQRVLEWNFVRFEHMQKSTDRSIEIDLTARFEWRKTGCARFAFALEIVNGFETILSVFQRLQQIHWISGKGNRLQLEQKEIMRMDFIDLHVRNKQLLATFDRSNDFADKFISDENPSDIWLARMIQLAAVHINSVRVCKSATIFEIRAQFGRVSAMQKAERIKTIRIDDVEMMQNQMGQETSFLK